MKSDCIAFLSMGLLCCVAALFIAKHYYTGPGWDLFPIGTLDLAAGVFFARTYTILRTPITEGPHES